MAADEGSHGGVSSSRSKQPERSTGGSDSDGGPPAYISPAPTQLQDAGSIAPAQRGNKRRHTAHQIQHLEAVFQGCSHPDYKQRLKLSEELGLKPQQVLYWFQNRRTIVKAQKDREDKTTLQEENGRLRWENNRMRAALRNMACPTCSYPTWLRCASPEEQRLRFENARLREKVERLSRTAAVYGISPAHP